MRTNIMALKYVFKYLKKCAFSAKIRDFGFDVLSIPVVAELSNFNTCVFSPIGTFFAIMQNFSKKKRDFEPSNGYSTPKAVINVLYRTAEQVYNAYCTKTNQQLLFQS